MTTIAFDGKRLAADRRVSGDGFTYLMTKIRRCPDGRLIGASGNASAVMALLDWLEAGAAGEPPVKLDSPDWGDMIEVMPDGAVHLWGLYGRFRINDKLAAIGSGSCYARAAMACGRAADAAIAVAALFDSKTGDSCDVLPLKAPR